MKQRTFSRKNLIIFQDLRTLASQELNSRNLGRLIPGILRKSCFLGIFVLAVFLRFFRIEENLIFFGEIGQNFLAIKNAINSGQLPLLGPPTSHPWLSFGPLYYWLFGPILALGNFDPRVGGYFGGSIGVLVVLLNYLVIKKIFGNNVALLSSFLITISPLWVSFTREARFFSLLLPFVYLFLFILEGGVKLVHPTGVKVNFFLLGLLLGLMLNFHYTALIFIPVFLSVALLKFNSRNLGRLIPGITHGMLKGLIGFLIPSLPFLVHDLGNRLEMLSNLVVWVPYRFAGFIGLYPKNTLSFQLVRENLASFYQFFNLSFLAKENLLGPVLLLVCTFFTIKKIRQPLILLWLGWGLVALFIHGAPPIHYFLPLFPLPVIIFSLFLSYLWVKKFGKLVACGLLLLITLVNLTFFFSEKWFFLPQDKMRLEPLYVPYNLQKEVTKTIIEDAQGRAYNLSRVGPYDHFEGNYAQNYRYLAWWYGNEPTEDKVDLHYTIYEGQTRVPKQLTKGAKLFWISNIAILKEEE